MSEVPRVDAVGDEDSVRSYDSEDQNRSNISGLFVSEDEEHKVTVKERAPPLFPVFLPRVLNPQGASVSLRQFLRIFSALKRARPVQRGPLR